MQTADWNISLFPSLILFRPGIKDELLFGLVAVLVISALYLLLAVGFSRFLPLKRKKAHRILTAICTIALFSVVFRMAGYANHIPFAPLYLILALLLLVPFITTLLTGSWFVLRSESSLPPKLRDSLRTGTWYSLLMLIPLILPLLLVQVPIAHMEDQLIYAGPLALSICLYLSMGFWFRKHSLSMLGLEMPQSELIPSLGKKFRETSAGIEQTGHCTIHIVVPGFRNALAFYPDNRILVGIDLIEYLEPKELRAVLLHELGHLKDRKYIRWMHKVYYCFPLFILLIEVLDQCGLFPGQGFSLFCFLMGICAISIVLKKLRIRAEYQADAYVRDNDADLQPFLLNGIHAIYELNGVDKNFCKQHNQGHLDPDERQKMLDHGDFILQRNVARPFIRTFLLYVLIGLVMGLLFYLGPRYIWPSNIQKWRTLHNAFHDQKYSDEQAARHSIQKALELSEQQFGELHNRTYISLNDLTGLNHLTGDLQAADQTSIRALAIGEQLYPDDLHKVRSLVKRADTLVLLKRWAEAEDLYTETFKFQQRLADTDENKTETLHDLINLYAQQNNYDKAISTYPKILQIHKSSREENRARQLMRTYASLASDLEDSGDRQGAVKTYQEGLDYMTQTFGSHYPDTIYLSCSHAQFLLAIDRLEASRDSYTDCLQGYMSFDTVEAEDLIYFQVTLAEISLALEDMDEAMRYVELARDKEEQLYGPEAPETSHTLFLMARIYEGRGDMANARKYDALSTRLSK